MRRALLLQEVKAVTGDQGALEMLSRGSCRLHVEKSAVKSLHGGGFRCHQAGFLKDTLEGLMQARLFHMLLFSFTLQLVPTINS